MCSNQMKCHDLDFRLISDQHLELFHEPLFSLIIFIILSLRSERLIIRSDRVESEG